MAVAIGSDHGGFLLKENLKEFLEEQNIDFTDFGSFSTEATDYPDIALKIAKSVASGDCEKGIIICGTGIGVCIAANKVRGIRAALCHDVFSAQMTRKHNNSNILTMGERVIGAGLAIEIVKTWLETEFEGGRHDRRIEKIGNIEKSEMN